MNVFHDLLFPPVVVGRAILYVDLDLCIPIWQANGLLGLVGIQATGLVLG